MSRLYGLRTHDMRPMLKYFYASFDVDFRHSTSVFFLPALERVESFRIFSMTAGNLLSNKSFFVPLPIVWLPSRLAGKRCGHIHISIDRRDKNPVWKSRPKNYPQSNFLSQPCPARLYIGHLFQRLNSLFITHQVPRINHSLLQQRTDYPPPPPPPFQTPHNPPQKPSPFQQPAFFPPPPPPYA